MATLAHEFLIDPGVTYLNFGSFGACPKPVFEKYQQYQLELEREPVAFITRKGMQYLNTSREALGKFVGAQVENLVFVTNPSYAVNAIVKSLPYGPGDEVLTTDIEYGACDKAFSFYAGKKGFAFTRVACQLPVQSEDEFVSYFLNHISEATKMIFISHVTSSTGLVLPVQRICEAAQAKGITCFVDGAHAPGLVPLDLDASPYDFYTGACHKWMMAPKGCSFMYAKPGFQHQVEPLIVSWGYHALFPGHSEFWDWHQMNGTRDYSAMLCVPECIDFMNQHQWDIVSAGYRKMALDLAPQVAEVLGSHLLAPPNEQWLRQMIAFPIRTSNPEQLHDLLEKEYRIQIPIMRNGKDVYLRYSLQAFNTEADIYKLVVALKDILAKSSLLERYA